ncbi:hypothetical protein [Nonomuraea sp. NPDC046570]|uniref:hypothetical protein n=1 Tax=Nonomuraea sp. NPDC046570 TaxID=3155255 RepID=UPI0033DB9261
MATEVEARKGSGVQTAFKVLVTLAAVAVLVQAVTAGQLMSGAAGGAHGMGSTAVHVLGLLQLIAAVLIWRPGRGPGWPALASLVALLLGFVQSAMGGSGVISVHVPLGMALFGLTVWLTVWAWTRRAPAGRPA